MRLPTGSSIGRAVACPPSMLLPQVSRESSEFAERGRVIHSFLEAARVDRVAALLAIGDDEIRAQCEAIDLSVIPDGAESEVPLAWHPERGSRRLDVTDREYPTEEGWYYGTLDLLGVISGAVWIRDFKTGHNRTEAAESWQLRFYALAAARYAGLGRANVGLLYLAEDGRWHEDVATFDEWDLDGFESTLRSLPGRAGTSRYAVGAHCQFCPSISFCPAQTTLARALVTEMTDLSASASELTPIQAGEAWERIKVAEALLDTAKEALKTRARAEALPLSGGKTLKEVISHRAKLHPDAARTLAEAHGAAAVLGIASVSIEAVTNAFGAEAVRALERAGLVSDVPVSQIRAVGGKRLRTAKAA